MSEPSATIAAAVVRDLDVLRAANERFRRTVDALDAAALAAPSALPGWSRAHVLTHIARNADAMRNLLLSARSTIPVRMYASGELRDADIAAGATRPAALVALDAVSSGERFVLDAAAQPPSSWTVTFPRTLVGRDLTAAEVPTHRLVELETHHVDLDAGYGWADQPAEVHDAVLDRVGARFAAAGFPPAELIAIDTGRRVRIGEGTHGDSTRTISGPAAELVAWALGRTDGAALLVEGGALPPSPGWG